MRKELDYQDVSELFWTDSRVVIFYINNGTKRFHTFVANRIQQIHDHTGPQQWQYIESRSNPADSDSRGLTGPQLVDDDSRWLKGPKFLWSPGAYQTEVEKNLQPLGSDDPEVKRASLVTQTSVTHAVHFETSRVDRFSDWFREKKAIAVCLRLKQRLKGEMKAEQVVKYQPVNEEIGQAELEIICGLQHKHFKDEIIILSSLQESEDFHNRKSYITYLILRQCHEETQHQGYGMTHNEVRQRGYWIIGGTSAVSRFVSKCVMCRRLRLPPQHQKLADLPEDRIEPAAPFTYSAVDYFGPFVVKEGRKDVKRYGVLFTCMSSRAIHIETANTLETDSFINAFRRFQAEGGPIRQLRSDQGTNFIGAHRELKEALKEIDQDKVRTSLLK